MRRILRRLTSIQTRRKLAFAIVKARQPTARWRPLPTALIIGAQRCGTSSLFKYLGAHPDCGPSIRKEIRFFTEFFDRGTDWYRSHFPMSWGGRREAKSVYFEATPDYLLDARAARRAIELIPDVRVIVLLRDPIERAYSQYLHNRRLGTEPLTFREALMAEPQRTRPFREALESDPHAPVSKEFLRYSYVERGRYSTQLKRWFEVIDSRRILILKSDDLFSATEEVFQRILSFLELEQWRPAQFKNYSYTSPRPAPPPIPPDCRRFLERELDIEIDSLEPIVSFPRNS